VSVLVIHKLLVVEAISSYNLTMLCYF